MVLHLEACNEFAGLISASLHLDNTAPKCHGGGESLATLDNFTATRFKA